MSAAFVCNNDKRRVCSSSHALSRSLPFCLPFPSLLLTCGVVTCSVHTAARSWRNFPALQQPMYPDQAVVDKVFNRIAEMPPLIFAGECRTLQERLAKASSGDAFVITGGDCAESFSQFSANRIRDFYRVLLQMSVVLAFGGGVPVIKLGRIAGQFAKPRSANDETIDGVTLPAYRGDIINGPEFTSGARIPDPDRLIQAYNQSASTLNLLRGFSTGRRKKEHTHIHTHTHTHTRTHTRTHARTHTHTHTHTYTHTHRHTHVLYKCTQACALTSTHT